MVETMMAVRGHAVGGPETLVYEEVERPSPGPSEVGDYHRERASALGITFRIRPP